MEKILLIVCILFWGFSSFLDKLALKYFSPIQLKFLSSIFATLFLTIIYILFSSNKIIFNKIGIIYTIISVILGIIGGLCLFLVLKNTNNIGSTIFMINTYPVITTILSIIFLNEGLSIIKCFGIFFIILGGVFINFK